MKNAKAWHVQTLDIGFTEIVLKALVNFVESRQGKIAGDHIF